jgi:8-oxo-dGTP pyrophosphatase MutT (NUDIX family)
MPIWDRLDQELVQRALRAPQGAVTLTAGRRAAVAALLAEGENGVELLLIRRAERASDPWSGHMALPGGHFDSGDVDLLATAVRETREELGIDLGREAQCLGRLDDFQPHRSLDLSVTPFVFGLATKPPVTPNAEVDLALWVSLAALAGDVSGFEHELTLAGQTLRFPAFRVGAHVVWGLTFRVVSALLRQIELESRAP